MLQTLASQGNDRLAVLERRHSLATVVSVVDALSPDHVQGAIKRYQCVIRGNSWYFPVLRDVDLSTFLVRWGNVHKAYFELADEIFALLAKGRPIDVLASSSLLTRVIQSETMRGWVGKRSPSGLDALLDTRVSQLESLLEPLGDDAVDEILSYGVYTGNPSRITAEHEIVELFSLYHREVGRELTIDMLDNPSAAASLLLRGFCRYSLREFNAKYRTLCDVMPRTVRAQSAEDAHEAIGRQINNLSTDTQARVCTLLEEVRVLNYLNLNLEVKYSFKGWAGLMHILAFTACGEATGISTDVYAMNNALKEAGE